jgi:hypothetical protein
MGIRSKLKDLRTPVAEIDAKRLREFCEGEGCTPIAQLVPREVASVVGEISSLRIVPRDGSPWLEATITDGTASMVALWTGRRHIAGVSAGKRLKISGRPAVTGARLTIYNPHYELL